jgi:hypothetical protein
MANYIALSARIKKELQELEREQLVPLVRDLRYVFESAKTDLTRFAETVAQISAEDSSSA